MDTSPESVAATLDKWQKRLGLSDWVVSAKFETQEHLTGQAKTTIYDTTQIAKICLLSPGDRQESDPNDSDIELDILHELIHVRLWSIDPKNPDPSTHVLREQAIEWIAKALIETDRKEKVCQK